MGPFTSPRLPMAKPYSWAWLKCSICKLLSLYSCLHDAIEAALKDAAPWLPWMSL